MTIAEHHADVMAVHLKLLQLSSPTMLSRALQKIMLKDAAGSDRPHAAIHADCA